jgi:hypothetical protein
LNALAISGDSRSRSRIREMRNGGMAMERDNLVWMFAATASAVVRASQNPGTLGYHVMKGLTAGGLTGFVFPFNRGEGELFGAGVYLSLTDVAQGVDLAVVVLPVQAEAEACRLLPLRARGTLERRCSLPRRSGRPQLPQSRESGYSARQPVEIPPPGDGKHWPLSCR